MSAASMKLKIKTLTRATISLMNGLNETLWLLATKKLRSSEVKNLSGTRFAMLARSISVWYPDS